jgi:hypothetical protein
MNELEYVLIPKPMEVPINRGPYAVDTHTAPARHLKFSPIHDAEIMAAAKTLNVPMTTFIRWCAIHSAQAVLKGKLRDEFGQLKQEEGDALARSS